MATEARYDKIYWDKSTCPRCYHTRGILRRKSHAGKIVSTWCTNCRKSSKVKAGPVEVKK